MTKGEALAAIDDAIAKIGPLRNSRLRSALHSEFIQSTGLELARIFGGQFPSNVAPMIWEDFTQDNMEAAFEKIGKELRAFGLL